MSEVSRCDTSSRFLLEEGLPITYRQQVVDYILNLMGQSSALPAVQTTNVDPFTSSGAYVPGASNFPAPGTSFGDPFTSGFPLQIARLNCLHSHGHKGALACQ